jgi:hypothetical protein
MNYNHLVLFVFISIFSFSCQPNEKQGYKKDMPHTIAAEDGELQSRGFVFYDQNHNLIKDEGEGGISGVAVSNSRQIVLTNEDGFYSLPVDNDDIIFVIKPKGWMTPVNDQMLPQFYYIHKPEGSPDHFEFKGVAPTGPLPEEINFPLYPEEYDNHFKMVVFGDPQPYSITEVDYIAEDMVDELIGQKELEFGMTMGDIVGDDLDLFNPLNEVIAQVGIPWYNVIGNHDMNFDALEDVLSDETYERIYGPSTYAFVYGDAHFIVIDDVIHMNDSAKVSYVGGLRKDQFEFVKNYLDIVPREDLIVLNMHIPLAQHGETFRKSDQKKLFDLLKDFPNTLSISAHSHVHEHMYFHEDSTDWSRPVPHHHFNVGTTSGSWWLGMKSETDVPHTMMRDGTPNGYSFIEFKGTEYIINWKVAGSSPDHQMNIYIKRGVIKGSKEENPLTVNFFNGCEQSKVEYRIKGTSDWREMDKVDDFDPYFLKVAKRWEGILKLKMREQWEADSSLSMSDYPGRRVPRHQKSTHLWRTNLGTDFDAGRYIIEVKATDRNGRVFTDYHSMRVLIVEEEDVN